jgi:hypothetical protein
MSEQDFIKKLSRKNADYNNPEQAITTANLCDTISKDINTDSKRFIYELLQNADDASSLSGILDVRIDFTDTYIVVSHKGLEFSTVDIESLSSAGDGTKAGDENKTGFKGIGFKSVFYHSDCVYVRTGNYCFKYDKDSWNDYWNNSWKDKTEWQNERIAKNKDAFVKMPWQIIPLWAELPNAVRHLDFNSYTVSTIIKHNKIFELERELKDLFAQTQIVLFLRSNKVCITINDLSEQQTILEKSVNNGITVLRRNGEILSEWLIKTDRFDLPQEVKDEINNDEKSPRKLREAQRAEISFAIQLQDNILRPVENALVFTYLPTSIKCGLPFLVNASFLTDAGRQHLHLDTFWNQWLFRQIALKYFEWIAELAERNSLYNRQFMDVIPCKMYGQGKLSERFNEGYDEALEKIAFIPNQNGELLIVSEALLDATRISISKCIREQTLVDYINSTTSKQFSTTSLLPYDIGHKSLLKTLGVKVFDVTDLDGFFLSDFFKQQHKLSENFNLIKFLYTQAHRGNENDRAEWDMRLKQMPFIFDENETLQKPELIYFPSVDEDFENGLKKEISVIHSDLLEKINENSQIKNWLETLGVTEPTDISFIERTIIGQSDFVTVENAIAVGRYLFNAYKRGELTENHYKNLRNFKLLTKQGALLSADEVFLSDFYEPSLKLEPVCDIDFFVSEKYFEDKDLKSEWKSFFLKIGISEKVDWIRYTINASKTYDKERFDFEYFEQKRGFPNDGHTNEILEYYVNKLSFMELCIDDYSFSSLFWQHVFSLFNPIIEKDSCNAHYYGKRTLNIKTYFEFFIDNLSIFPTSQSNVKIASEIFINTKENKELAGKYLPVLDYDGVLTDEWKEILPLKKELKFEDYREILTAISEERSTDEDVIKENKERIMKIYSKIADNNYVTNNKDKLKQWGQTAKLLAKDDKYYSPNDLAYITIDGFNAPNLIYTNRPGAKVIDLFRLWGVKVIDSIEPKFETEPTESDSLKAKLLQISPLIALVSTDKYSDNDYSDIKNRIQDAHFYETDGITLSYGNEEDRQERSTFAKEGKFYYVGQWNKTTVLDGLADKICEFLHIKKAERMMIVLLSSSFDDGKIYLKEKGYDVSSIPNEEIKEKELPVKTEDDVTLSDNLLDNTDENTRILIQAEAQEKIFESLRNKGYSIPETLQKISFTVVDGVVHPKNGHVRIVTKSAKGGTIYFTPFEWLALCEPNSQLFIISSGNNVYPVSIEDLERTNDKFHLRFNTETFAVRANLKVFAQLVRQLPETHFLFKAPINTTDFFKPFGLDSKNTSVVELSADDLKLLD